MTEADFFLNLSATVLGLIVVGGGLWFVIRRYAPAVTNRAVMEASEATAELWRRRSEAQDQQITDMEIEMAHMKQQIARLEGETTALREYAAPEAIKRFEQQQSVMIEILRAIAKNQENAATKLEERPAT